MKDIIQYSYSQLTETLISDCVLDLINLYDKGMVKPGLPQQTTDILFSIENPKWSSNWDMLRKTFLHSVKEYTGIEYKNSKAWAFACFPNTKGDQRRWHTHPNARYSGVMYLSLPEGSETTEFEDDDGSSFFLPAKIGSWFMFQGEHPHQNGDWDGSINDYRFCLAASAW